MTKEWEDRLDHIVWVVAVVVGLCAGIAKFSGVRKERREVARNLQEVKAQTYTRDSFVELSLRAAHTLFRLPDPNTDLVSRAEFILEQLEDPLFAPGVAPVVKDSYDPNMPREVNVERIARTLVEAGLWTRTRLVDANVPESQRWAHLKYLHAGVLESNGLTATQIDDLFDPNVGDESKWKTLNGWRIKQLEAAGTGLPSPRESAVTRGAIAFCIVYLAYSVYILLRGI